MAAAQVFLSGKAGNRVETRHVFSSPAIKLRGDFSDYLKWRASKLKPRVYGERTEQYVQNVTNNVVVLTEDRARELQERLKRLLP